MYQPKYLNRMIQVEDFLFGTVIGDDPGIDQWPGLYPDRCQHPSKMEKPRQVRVLLAKASQNGHDREVQMAALTFLNAGFEVIYLGSRQTPEQILSAAIQEDVQLIGLNVLPGENGCSFPRVLELLKENGAEDISVVGLGSFRHEDARKLEEMGVKTIFEAGAKSGDVKDWVGNNVTVR